MKQKALTLINSKLKRGNLSLYGKLNNAPFFTCTKMANFCEIVRDIAEWNNLPKKSRNLFYSYQQVHRPQTQLFSKTKKQIKTWSSQFCVLVWFVLIIFLLLINIQKRIQTNQLLKHIRYKSSLVITFILFSAYLIYH